MIAGVGVHIKTKDFQKSLTFYEALGFKKTFEIGPNKKIQEDYNMVMFDTGSGILEIADGLQVVKPEVFKETVTSPKISLMINTDNMEELLEQCKKADIPLAVGVRHYYWGNLEFVLKDPDGVILVFITKYTPELAAKLNADEKYSQHF
mgnify:CR=1 FL=1